MTMTLEALNARIAERAAGSPDESYTAKLLKAGVARCAKKLGEESAEMIIAAMARDKAEIAAESADLLYHFLVLLRAAGVDLADVMDELDRRTGQSGLAEKASREDRSS
jgi:phosphoribosyl-ATP pyrophosphohydrolase